MKKIFMRNGFAIIPILIVVVLIVIIGWILYKNQNQKIPSESSIILNEASDSIKTPEKNDFTASFEIFTNGTKRIFTAGMYHNQDPNVFIKNPDPGIVYVKKVGITWVDFFNTLPFSLDKNCLTTGNREKYCSEGNKKLRFFLNDIETPDALDLKIQPQDELRVTYGN